MYLLRIERLTCSSWPSLQTPTIKLQVYSQIRLNSAVEYYLPIPSEFLFPPLSAG